MTLRFAYITSGVPVDGKILLFPAAKAIGPDSQRFDRYICESLDFLASTASRCDELIQSLDSACETGARVEFGAEEVELIIQPPEVQINILVSAEWIGAQDGRFTVAQVRNALAGWKRFLELPENLDSVVTIDI